MIHENERQTAFKAANITGSADRGCRADSDYETDAHDEATTIHGPSRNYEICHMQGFEAPSTHGKSQMHVFHKTK